MSVLRHSNSVTLACVVLLVLGGCSGKGPRRVVTETVLVKSAQDILSISDSLVRPILYKDVRGLDSLSLAESKEKFISALLPAVLVAKHERENDRLKYSMLAAKHTWSDEDSSLYRYLRDRYKFTGTDDASLRMQTYPTSIVIAQAAIESGWGTSRFFEEAHNVFGVWSFNEKDVRLEAATARNGRKVYLRAYPDLSASVKDYLDVLSRSNAFRGLRIARESTDDPYQLLPYLTNYSERKTRYTALVRKVIEQNRLTRFDRYQIHPDYLVAE